MSKYVFFVLILVFSSVLFFTKITSGYRMPASYNYDSDFGRDMLKMEEISQGKFTLVGPQLSIAGLRLAPYHFYLFAPLLKIFNDYRAVVYANAVIFIAGFLILYHILKNRFGPFYSFVSVFWLITTPYVILAARSPGNAFSYLIGLVLLVAFYFKTVEITGFGHFFLGVVNGIIVNYHPITSILLIPVHVLKLKKAGNILAAGLGFFLTFTPVIVFDLRHRFVLSKLLFNPVQYQKLSSTAGPFISRFQDFISVNSFTGQFFPPTLLGLLAVSILLYKRNQTGRKYFPFLIIAFLNTAFLFFLGQGAIHYFFPVFVLLQILVIFLAGKTYIYVLAGLVVLNFAFFPVRLYKPARNLADVEKKVTGAINVNFFPKTEFNIVLLNDTGLSKVGYEYRYLLLKNGYSLNDEYSYAGSKYLVMVSERGDINWKKERSWEIDQFGKKTLVGKINSKGYFFYLFKK